MSGEELKEEALASCEGGKKGYKKEGGLSVWSKGGKRREDSSHGHENTSPQEHRFSFTVGYVVPTS